MNLLRNNLATLLDLLPESIVDQLRATGRPKQYAAGTLIQRRGDTRRGLSILLRGRIMAGNLGADGSRVVTSVLHPGECFGEATLFAELPRTHDLTAVTEAQVLHIPARSFTPIFDAEPAIARALLSITLRRTHDLLEFLDGQRRLPLVVRLARVLLSFRDEAQSHPAIVCRQEELAYLLGVTRMSVGTALAELAANNFLETGYGKILLKDVAGMSRWVEERSLVTPVAAPRMTVAAASG